MNSIPNGTIQSIHEPANRSGYFCGCPKEEIPWKQFEGKVQRQWGKLTDDDLAQVKGDQKVLAGKIQERYGVTKEEAERQIHEWHSKLQ